MTNAVELYFWRYVIMTICFAIFFIGMSEYKDYVERRSAKEPKGQGAQFPESWRESKWK